MTAEQMHLVAQMRIRETERDSDSLGGDFTHVTTILATAFIEHCHRRGMTRSQILYLLSPLMDGFHIRGEIPS